LRTEEPYLELGKVVPFTLKSGDPTSIIQDLIPETSFLEGNELSGDSVHREGRRKGNKRPRNEIGGTWTDALRASRVHDQFKMVIL
jgi:hypothetical protein